MNNDKIDYIIVDYYYCKKCGKFHYSHTLYAQNQYKHKGFRNHLKYKSFKLKSVIE